MLSLIDPATNPTEADAYHTARGNTGWTGSDPTKTAAIRRAQDALAGKYNSRWMVAFENDDAPTEVKYAIAQAALLEIQTPGVLSPSLERGGAVKRLRERVEGAVEVETEWMDGASVETTFTAIENLLIGAGLIRTGTTLTGFVARA